MTKYKIPSHEYELSYSRSSGAGGQNINKVNTKATLRWCALKSESLPPDVLGRFLEKYKNKLNDEGQLTLASQAHRTQHLNTAEVIKKLHEMIESIAYPPKIRKATKPTKSSVNERIKTKKSKGDIKKLRSEKFY